MKGAVFQAFAKFVEENFGDEFWEEVIEGVDPESDAIYVATKSYDDEELFKLVGFVCEKKELDILDAVESFGQYLFPILADKYSAFLKKGMSLKEFILSIDNVIHVEVRKLYPDAHLPTISYIENDDSNIAMNYSSPRKLCRLAIGLMRGAADYFKGEISINESQCMHMGSDACHINVEFISDPKL
ncbi:heme NO-binding domain-containing protein [Piscirickettsia litoralis]|uniref:4-vinyl reductase 4VR domain-containing protein n=1 Tax=Piscirickettsia litoralis TaxID=1891921 RepID=A0ABX2ZZA6_9GAMM|nr:heme NO-binding domain-containing protein [Piscirickettsia litoralis]ODN41936.1 hypothetical protein BGC07_01860 [Piscirickettsia litoralis]